MEEEIDFQKENKKLTRKVKLLEQSLEQFKSIKTKYDDLIVKLNEKDAKLQEVNENLEIKVFERTLELQSYIDAVNSVALVVTFDEKLNIIDANDTFIRKIAYSKEELLELNISDIMKSVNSSIFISELREKLDHNEIFKYTNKFTVKNDKEDFFVKNSYFEIEEDDEQKKIISIGFLITDETLEKKEFNKKVVEKIREVNQKDLENKKLIQSLNLKIQQYEDYIRTVQKELMEQKEKVVIKSKQIINFEEQLSKVDKKYQNIMVSKNKELEKFSKVLHILKSENEHFHEENEDLKKIVGKLQKDLEK